MLLRTAFGSIIVYYFALVIEHINGKSITIPSRSTRDLTSTYTHYLFTIRRFEVILKLKNDPSLKYVPSLNIIAENVTTATSEFLTKCMNKHLILHGAAEEAMDTLHINVNAYLSTRDGKLIGTGRDDQFVKTIIDGHVKFRDIIIPSSLSRGNRTDDHRINQEYIEKIVQNDCLSDDLAQYLKRIKDNLTMLSSADVNAKTYKSGMPSDVDAIDQDDAFKSGGIIVGVLLSLSLLVFVGGLYIFFSRDFHLKRGTGYNEDGHILLSDIETYSDEGDEDRSQRLQSEATGERHANSELVAVPARDDALFGISKRKQDLVKAIAPRRYVQTASPFDVLYGAAFSHHDQERVEEAHRPKSVKKLQPHRKRSVDKSKPLQPMVAISEEKECSKESSSQDTMRLFPQFMSKFSTFLSVQDNQDDKQGNSLEDELVVYRDFPRHDGTPCVMYTPKDEVDWNYMPQTLKLSQSAYQTDDVDDNLSHSSLSQSSSMGSSMVAGIDNFVDKLERLVASRSRQYQERVKMERERLERRKAHEKDRFKEKNQLDEEKDKLITIETKKSVSELESQSYSVIIPPIENLSETPDVDSVPTPEPVLDSTSNEIDYRGEDNKENIENTNKTDTKPRDNGSDSELKTKATGLKQRDQRIYSNTCQG